MKAEFDFKVSGCPDHPDAGVRVAIPQDFESTEDFMTKAVRVTCGICSRTGYTSYEDGIVSIVWQ